MAKLIQGTGKNLGKNLSICECERDGEGPRGYWLYDEIAGMNLAMREPDRDKAFVKVIEYWQKRCARAEQAYNNLNAKVDSFVSQFTPIDADGCDD